MDRAGRALGFAGVALAYLAAGKLGLMLASVHPSSTAVWAPTGIALAAFLRMGPGVWPAIFCAAFVVNVTTASSIATSLGIAALVSPAVSAVFGVTSLALGGYARWADYGAIWATWWLGDVAGALIVAPPLLLWSEGRPLPWLHRRRLPEALVILLVVVAGGPAVF